MNRKRAFALLLLVSGACLALAQAWTPFENKSGAYKINFPGKPEQQVQDIKTEVGTVKAIMHMAIKGDTVFLVSFNDYPVNIQDSKMDEILTGAANGVSGNTPLKSVVRSKDKEARSIQFEFTKKSEEGGTSSGLAKIFLRKNRLYQILVMRDGAVTAQQRKDCKIFFDSFKFTPMIPAASLGG